jgi:hypothetical protein
MDLQKRVVGIVRNPEAEWRVIAGERDDIPSLYRRYIAIIAAIPAVAILLGVALISRPFLGTFALTTALTTAVTTYVIALVSPLIAALVIAQLAPYFKSERDNVQALKVVAYAWTPVWLAGLCYLFVALWPLVVVGWLWAIYLFYVGLPLVLKTPHEQVVPFMVVSAIAIVVITVVLRLMISASNVPYYY